jgi:hypothetical protein
VIWRIPGILGNHRGILGIIKCNRKRGTIPLEKTGKPCKAFRAGNEFFDILVFTSCGKKFSKKMPLPLFVMSFYIFLRFTFLSKK